jgi:hypothetical protein
VLASVSGPVSWALASVLDQRWMTECTASTIHSSQRIQYPPRSMWHHSKSCRRTAPRQGSMTLLCVFDACARQGHKC